jgi:hypothetical protein
MDTPGSPSDWKPRAVITTPMVLSLRKVYAMVMLVVVLEVAVPETYVNSNTPGFTTKLTDELAEDPTFGVAVNVPLYDPAAVPDVTVTVPQVDAPPHTPVGPDTVAPAMAEYEMEPMAV